MRKRRDPVGADARLPVSLPDIDANTHAILKAAAALAKTTLGQFVRDSAVETALKVLRRRRIR